MATAFIDGVIGQLGALAGQQVVNQASILLNFRKDFAWLHRKLQYVKGFLQYAHDFNNESVKRWLADVQDIAFDAEDIVEERVVQPLYRNSFQVWNSLIFRYKMGRRIRALKKRVESIMKDAADLRLVHQLIPSNQPSTVYGRVEGWKKSSLLERGAKPIAIDAKVEQILNLLKIDALQVIAVVGMGGIGKTFLLQNVYNHPWVGEKFKKLIWLSISQVYSVAKLQSDIASHLSLKDEVNGVTEQRAAELIHERLRDKVNLIVLDDVWRVEGVDNMIQRLGIPAGTSCKVVVTTRSIEVCKMMGASKIYHVDHLLEEDSWNLFCHHAFPDYQPSHEVEEVAHQVERECGGLPLAIKTVAASMAMEEQLRNWESKLRQLKEVGDAQDPVIPILRLSYDALPAVLKPCFLYFSSFGEDEEIDAEYLIYSWIGESFIPQGEEQWKTGMLYLDTLKDLCLLEVREDDKLRKTCKIHDLLRDLAIYISIENKCAFTVSEASSANGCRRILLAKKGLNTADIINIPFDCSPSLRTLSLSRNNIEELPAKSLSCVPALRVIDLSHTGIRQLPIWIGNLKLLRVLNFSNTWIHEVPDCVRNLKRLCFLDVGDCQVPNWIGDLKCLQYLCAESVGRQDYFSPEASRGISELISLRTLRATVWVLKDVANLLHLQELHVTITEEEYTSLEEGVLAQLLNMRRLTIELTDEYERKKLFPLFPENMKAMKDLEYLCLSGFTVPRWMCEYGNLKVLMLWYNLWREYPALDRMPNLKTLEICPQGRSLKLPESFGKSGAFPQLRSLFTKYCGWPELQQGAMPLLEKFTLMRTEEEEIPEGFEHLRSLKRLRLESHGFSVEEEERFKEGGEYRNRIKANIPYVSINFYL